MPRPQVIIVGAGAEMGAEALLLEKMDRPGIKLRITGQGRCNLTNVDPLREALKHFEPNRYFLRPAFYGIQNQ